MIKLMHIFLFKTVKDFIIVKLNIATDDLNHQ